MIAVAWARPKDARAKKDCNQTMSARNENDDEDKVITHIQVDVNMAGFMYRGIPGSVSVPQCSGNKGTVIMGRPPCGVESFTCQSRTFDPNVRSPVYVV